MGQAASKQEAFWEACGFGHIQRVKKFIDEGIDVDWVSYTHNSCAIHVASQGKTEIVEMLLAAGCNVNAKDDRENLALHHAAMKGYSGIMKLLLDAGSELNAQDKNGWTALLNAAYWCQPEAVKVLLDTNCDITLTNKHSRTALHECCRSQTTNEADLSRIAEMLVLAGCDLNQKASDVGEADFTSLMFASYHGHSAVIEVLIKHGCNLNSVGTNKWSALHWAVDQCHPKTVSILLSSDIDRTLQGLRGELAVDRAKSDEIRSLLKDGECAESSNKQQSGKTRVSQPRMSSKDLSKFIAETVTSACRVGRPKVESDKDSSGDGWYSEDETTKNTDTAPLADHEDDLNHAILDKTGYDEPEHKQEDVRVFDEYKHTIGAKKGEDTCTCIESDCNETATICTGSVTGSVTSDDLKKSTRETQVAETSSTDGEVGLASSESETEHSSKAEAGIAPESADDVSEQFLFKQMEKWSVVEVCRWLHHVGLNQDAVASFKVAEVNGPVLKRLNMRDLNEYTPDVDSGDRQTIIIERDAHLDFESELTNIPYGTALS